MRVGILGASRIAAEAILAPARRIGGVEVVAIAARDPDKAQARFGVCDRSRKGRKKRDAGAV